MSPAGSVLVNTSATTNMAHFIDTKTLEVTDNVLVDARPRVAMFTADGDVFGLPAYPTPDVVDPTAPAAGVPFATLAVFYNETVATIANVLLLAAVLFMAFVFILMASWLKPDAD